ncbi:hypothetical protein [Ectobacillus panaciterrae]|uniref:hypothetical protein n=1 Tax=Ectobacillus panaciterrae TaxID=363872 RepID=UPI00041F7020|nr:hypothetical protein [Ectobacillus panaciterrae]
MIDIYTSELRKAGEALLEQVRDGKVENKDYFHLGVELLEILQHTKPEQMEYVNMQAEYYHLDGNLRRAGEKYRRVLEIDPVQECTEEDIRRIKKFCPILMTTPKECFPLKDVVAIHHPTKPLIGYHLFWEDDYDFPDDYEPCDHEELWIEYNPTQDVITKVMTFFHSRVLESTLAVEEAHENGQRPIIRIEWGKHGSLLAGWKDMQEPLTRVSLEEWITKTYEHVKAGGRVSTHPLKKYWPKGFDGTFAEYIDFSISVDPLSFLKKKPYMFKTKWVNASIFTQCLLYNFHPKMEWPDRFWTSLDENGIIQNLQNRKHSSYQVVSKE